MPRLAVFLMIIRGSGGSAAWTDTGLGYEQIVATGGRVPVSTLTTTSTKTRIDWRQAFKFGGQNVSQFRLLFCNYSASDTENNPGNTVFIEADVELVGVPRPGPVKVRFSGAFIGSMADGTAIYQSDVIIAQAFGLTVIPASTLGFVNGSVSVATVGHIIPYSNSYTFGTGEGAVSSARSSAQGGSGAAPSIPPGGASFTGIGPLLGIVGEFTSAEVSLLIAGDSIMHHNADTFAAGLDGASGGVAVRGAYSVGGRTIPWINVAVGGSTVVSTSTNFTKRAQLAAYATHKICNLATNDWAGSAGTPSVATMLAAANTMAGLLGAHTDYVTCIPRTTGTFTTAAGQTPLNSNYQAGGFRDQFNAGLSGQTNIAGVIDLDAAVRDATITDAFTANYTDFGTHPFGGGLTAGATAMATRFAAYIGGHP